MRSSVYCPAKALRLNRYFPSHLICEEIFWDWWILFIGAIVQPHWVVVLQRVIPGRLCPSARFITWKQLCAFRVIPISLSGILGKKKKKKRMDEWILCSEKSTKLVIKWSGHAMSQCSCGTCDPRHRHNKGIVCSHWIVRTILCPV